MQGKIINMFVYNNCDKDARVLKEAGSLVKAGYHVKIFAVLDANTVPYEVRDGIEIIRVIKDPLHYRLMRVDLKGLFFKPQYDTLSQLRSGYNPTNSELAENSSEVKQKQIKAAKSRGGMVRRRIKAFVKNYISILLKKPLMMFHKPLCFYDFYQKTKPYCIEEAADVYHGHDLHTVPTAFKCAKITSARVVYDAHELYTEMSGLRKIERKLYTRWERRYAPKVDTLITVNQSIAEELVKRYGLSKTPDIIFNCPEVNDNIILTDEDVLRKKLNLSASEKIILYQGGYSPNRGLQNLVKAAQYINQGIVVFMGWGKIEPELRSLVSDLGLENKVLFTPGVPQNELLNHSKSADIGVIPYQFVGLNNYYTSPNKLFEYINASVPIAGSDFPELKRVIDKYNIGVTFDPESPKNIAESINKVMEDDTLRITFKENTKQAAIDFRWENEEKKLISIYSNLG